MTNLKYITPQFFHYWLNDCPVKWIKEKDNITTVTITFQLPIEEDKVWLTQHKLPPTI